LKLLQHFRSMLGCRDVTGLLLYCLQNLHLKAFINYD
jgi:hypothetical protein